MTSCAPPMNASATRSPPARSRTSPGARRPRRPKDDEPPQHRERRAVGADRRILAGRSRRPDDSRLRDHGDRPIGADRRGGRPLRPGDAGSAQHSGRAGAGRRPPRGRGPHAPLRDRHRELGGGRPRPRRDLRRHPARVHARRRGWIGRSHDAGRNRSRGRAPRVKVAVSGATGLIGGALAARLMREGHDVVPLVRRPVSPGEQAIAWDPARGTIDRVALEGCDAVVNLAGESVFGRWSAEKKRRIRESRVNGTRLVSEAIAGLSRRPRVLLAASAIGYYGDRGAEELNEQSSPGDDFLAGVAREWEAAAAPAARAGVRVVHLRFGVVLTPVGGALARMLPAFRLGLGGPVGSGAQYLSWIALDDVLGAIAHVLATEDLTGPVNITAPHPVTHREFAGTLGRVLRRPAALPVPGFALQLLFGAEAAAMLQSGQRVLP